MFSAEAISDITAVATEFSIEPAALLAVAEIESGGSVFAVINGKPEPLIRFEGHYFDRRLSGEKLTQARAEGLAAPKAGAIANPAAQAARWRLLERAAAIDPRAAHESVSWGLGQVMGAHWAWLGFASVDALVAEARSGAAGQARLMARYIDRAGLVPALRAHDWPAFARGYNGPGCAQNGYDRRIATAYARYQTTGGQAAGSSVAAARKTASPNRSALRRGCSGEPVQNLQRSLAALGYALAIDGRFGPGTEKAVRSFQADHRLTADGIAGPTTLSAMARALPFGATPAGWWTKLLAWLARLVR